MDIHSISRGLSPCLKCLQKSQNPLQCEFIELVGQLSTTGRKQSHRLTVSPRVGPSRPLHQTRVNPVDFAKRPVAVCSLSKITTSCKPCGIHSHTFAHRVHIFKHVHMHARTQTQICLYTWMHRHAYMQACNLAQMHPHVHTHACTLALGPRPSAFRPRPSVCLGVST